MNGVITAVRQNLALPTPQLLDKVLQSALAFSNSEAFEDDVCLLGIETAAGAKV
jgi:serine phosphatase RsbU (regulator of sigma subunit)